MTYSKVEFERKKAKTRNAIKLKGRKAGYHQGKKRYETDEFYRDYLDDIEDMHNELNEYHERNP